MLDRVLAFFNRERIVHKAPRSGSNPEMGMRFEIDKADGSGYKMFHRFENGLEVTLSDQFLIRSLSYSLKNMHTHFGLSIILDGHVLMEIPDLDQKQQVEAGEIAFRRGSVGVVKPTFPAGKRLRALSIDVPSGMLETWQSQAPDSLNRGISALLNDSKAAYLRVFPADEAVMVMAEKMLDTDTQTSSGRLQFEATALSLLARILDPGSPSVAHLTRAQMREENLQNALDQAIDILRLEWSSPPTIAELARRIGLNHSTMQYEFRQRTGQTIGEYTHRLRMERALDLIETGGFTVLETALQVGYTNPSYFSNAFRKYYGYLPSSCRQK